MLLLLRRREWRAAAVPILTQAPAERSPAAPRRVPVGRRVVRLGLPARHLVSCIVMDGQLELSLGAARRQPLNVTQLVRAVRDVLEAGLGEYWVVDEISNARLAPSKHLYFTLKDARSAVSGVMFASAHRRLRFHVEDGMEVIVRGRVNL